MDHNYYCYIYIPLYPSGREYHSYTYPTCRVYIHRWDNYMEINMNVITTAWSVFCFLRLCTFFLRAIS